MVMKGCVVSCHGEEIFANSCVTKVSDSLLKGKSICLSFLRFSSRSAQGQAGKSVSSRVMLVRLYLATVAITLPDFSKPRRGLGSTTIQSGAKREEFKFTASWLYSQRLT